MEFQRDFDNKGQSQGISMPWVERAPRHLCLGPGGVCSRSRALGTVQMPMQRDNAWDSRVCCGWGGADVLSLVGGLGRVLTSVSAARLISHLILSCQRGQCWSRSHSWSTGIPVQTQQTTGMLPALHFHTGKTELPGKAEINRSSTGCLAGI